MRKVLIIKFCTTMAIGNIKLRAGDCEKIFTRWGHEECESLISCRVLVTKDRGLRGIRVPGSHSPGPGPSSHKQPNQNNDTHLSLLICVTMGPGAPVIQNVPGSLDEHKIFGWIIKYFRFRELKISQYQVIWFDCLCVNFYFWANITYFFVVVLH